MSAIGMDLLYRKQDGEYAKGRVIAEYQRYVVLDTEFGYRTCVHKADLMNEKETKR